MSDLIIHGGTPLKGEIVPSANKNAVLPILCATLLCKEPIRLVGLPDITDARKILQVFRDLGSEVKLDAATGTLDIHHKDTRFDETKDRLPEEMRSSIMLVPPLLARFGVARIESDVQGCTLGVREIDPHIELFELFGAAITRLPGAIIARLSGPLRAAQNWPDYASVTATENFVLCAALAQGTSTLTNAACEPHVQEFCQFMVKLGAKIDGIGTSRLTVTGVPSLKGASFSFTEDFHEVVTFLALGAITGGAIKIKNSSPEVFPLLDRTFGKFGITVTHKDGWSQAQVQPGGLQVRQPFTANILQKIEAAPWPYIPVDLLPIFVAVGVCAQGNAMFWNKIYEGAMGWTSELSKFGAHALLCDPHRMITFGGKQLTPAEVESPYIIRVAIALLMVAASIPGRSVIKNAHPIRRAHPNFAENLTKLGAKIEWVDN
jgi:UDP-N-acetylglucosamine 1-carboxyvinyltransferase